MRLILRKYDIQAAISASLVSQEPDHFLLQHWMYQSFYILVMPRAAEVASHASQMDVAVSSYQANKLCDNLFLPASA